MEVRPRTRNCSRRDHGGDGHFCSLDKSPRRAWLAPRKRRRRQPDDGRRRLRVGRRCRGEGKKGPWILLPVLGLRRQQPHQCMLHGPGLLGPARGRSRCIILVPCGGGSWGFGPSHVFPGCSREEKGLGRTPFAAGIPRCSKQAPVAPVQPPKSQRPHSRSPES